MRLIVYLLMVILVSSFAFATLDSITNYYSYNSDADDDYGSNDGSVTGATLVTGKIDDAYSFDGSDDYMSYAQFNGVKSINFWLRLDTSSPSNLWLVDNRDSSGDKEGYAFYLDASGNLHLTNDIGASSQLIISDTFSWSSGVYYMITLVIDNSNGNKIYVNGTSVNLSTNTVSGSALQDMTGNTAYVGADEGSSYTLTGDIDELGFWSKALTQSEISDLYNNGTGLGYPFSSLYGAPNISAINCTSCNIPYGDNETPYTTTDITPTFSFNTNIYAYCRISNSADNYSVMGESRNCTTGEGGIHHICTLGVSDALNESVDYVYLACINNGLNNESLETLEMEIRGFDELEDGIKASIVWPGATVYDNQQIYLRDASNNQLLETVDKVVVYGNQRWLLNYEPSVKLGLFNLTPVVYVLDMIDMNETAISDMVEDFINTTKE